MTFDRSAAAIIATVVVAATAPLWLWAADSALHFGYAP